MLVFHNQLSFVNVAVGRVGEEHQNTDYEKFDKSLGQFMGSITIMIHMLQAGKLQNRSLRSQSHHLAARTNNPQNVKKTHFLR